MSLLLMTFLVIIGLGLLWLIYQVVWGTPPWINLAVERIGLKLLLLDPEALTTLGLLDNSLIDFYSDKLTDVSPRQMTRLQQLDREALALVRRYDAEKLTGQKSVTHKLMVWYFQQRISGHHFEYHWENNSVFMGPYPVNHVFGVHVDLINFLCTYHHIKNRKSIRRYIKRLQRIDWKLSGLLESVQLREASDVIPPQFVLHKSLAQLDEFLAKPLEENPLYTSFIEKLTDLNRFDQKMIEKWGREVLNVLEKEVIPAYRKFQSALWEMVETAPTQDGVWQLSRGKDYYAFLLAMHTTTNLSPGEVHQIGLDEVTHLTEEIQAVLKTLGLPAENPGHQLKSLMEDPQFHYHGEGARAEIIEDYQVILDDINQCLPAIFNHGSLDAIQVKRLPDFKEPDSPIAYAEAPAMNGRRPGMMWLNLRDVNNVYRWGMRTLAYHEAIPGHVYQMAQAQKIKKLPIFRRTFFLNAYVEGWALYAERLGWELGLEDPMSNLGRLQALMWRAVRLVVDTGIHVMGWSRQEATDYMIEKTGLPERDVITEVERYVVMPGQACAYYLGYLKFMALRRKAESILGEGFDLKAFHDVLINNGGLPLGLLEDVVDEYIDRVAGLSPG